MDIFFRGSDYKSDSQSYPEENQEGEFQIIILTREDALSIYLLLTLPNPYEKEIERLSKLLAEVGTDEDSEFDNEDIGSEDVLEVNFSDHESFSKHDTELEKRTEILEMKN
ncbi:hypothetical protein AVEN_129849-1 [Araneus ventricosus]|uniref:Uncharacterized protein n=1 Tax=Araneus ventricosus TaxID=182803 RepID=A0A4Y2K5V5_ARAVE|nr:hypothetical protein AVEN_129849-1 [Araneus ventricosus]